MNMLVYKHMFIYQCVECVEDWAGCSPQLDAGLVHFESQKNQEEGVGHHDDQIPDANPTFSIN